MVEPYDHFPLIDFHFWHLVVKERKRSKIRIDESMKGSSRTRHPLLYRTRVQMLARRCSNNCHSKVSRDDEMLLPAVSCGLLSVEESLREPWVPRNTSRDGNGYCSGVNTPACPAGIFSSGIVPKQNPHLPVTHDRQDMLMARPSREMTFPCTGASSSRSGQRSASLVDGRISWWAELEVDFTPGGSA